MPGPLYLSGGAKILSAKSDSSPVRSVCGAPAGIVTKSPPLISHSLLQKRAVRFRPTLQCPTKRVSAKPNIDLLRRHSHPPPPPENRLPNPVLLTVSL